MKNNLFALALTLSALPISISTSINPAIAESTPVEPSVSIRAFNLRSYYIRHRNFLGEVSLISSSLDRGDASFRVRSGLASSDCVSFESSNLPGYYLRHQNFQIRLDRNDNTAQLKADATFCIKPGLASLTNVSFQSYNFPTYYIRHRNFKLYIDPYTTDSLFLNDATFTLVAPFTR
ncbi:MAG: AbfB domain-containing protein [Nostoc sp. DedQUE08]|uniref:AbfB domain-containing protein n=1 Tax=Nostoc sp. DedQUE08 TaxID=3075393 RepID=UPI002AD3ADA5|nr:AbfB domain-containing protein [Nostoc sp. DedQUE08]MDZ8064548.1 AbfB domain-containing protein [Nostoc sp. DedQUE08]